MFNNLMKSTPGFFGFPLMFSYILLGKLNGYFGKIDKTLEVTATYSHPIWWSL